MSLQQHLGRRTKMRRSDKTKTIDKNQFEQSSLLCQVQHQALWAQSGKDRVLKLGWSPLNN